LDEPTSGLDSYNATQVMQNLAALAHNDKKTIIFTIHQPRSDIFALFDKVLLLARGKQLYFGSSAGASEHFARDGFPCPAGYNIADHLLDIAAGVANQGGKANETNTEELKSGDQGVFIEIPPPTYDNDVSKSSTSPKETFMNMFKGFGKKAPAETEDALASSFFTQLYYVLGRGVTNISRRPGNFLAHFIASTILGAFIGGVYFQANNSLGGIQNRLGSIFFLQTLIGFSGLSAITTFTAERVLFMRERSNGFYGPMPFFISKIVFDLVPLRLLPGFSMSTIAFFMIGYSADPIVYFRYIVAMLLHAANTALYCLALGCMFLDTTTATLVTLANLRLQVFSCCSRCFSPVFS
jgi:ABC-2 type transporter